MSTVKFPAVLRASVGGAREVEVAGATVGEILDALVGVYPTLRDQLFTEDGELNRFVNVYLNGQDVRYLDGRGTAVADRDEVRLLPAMAGGAGAATATGAGEAGGARAATATGAGEAGGAGAATATGAGEAG